MTGFNWNNIRSYNSSQNNAFEELVCQLAREEEIPNKKKFLRIGAPDGGVEAYWILENGDEHGWQAKFFQSVETSQWQQLEKSFKNAIKKRPNLVKYYISIPLDRQDPKIPNQKWFMDKWNEKIIEWEEYAGSKGRKIEFEYWGSSKLIHRLSLEKHAGRRYFWFNQQEFSNEWLSEKLERSIDDLGNRYTPDLNFELDIAKIFDGLARDYNFKKQFEEVYDDLFIKANDCLNGLRDERLKEVKDKINRNHRQIQYLFDNIDFAYSDDIDHQFRF